LINGGCDEKQTANYHHVSLILSPKNNQSQSVSQTQVSPVSIRI
jgi:hypothetical protein